MQAVILAAGRGTRLYPITATRTKAMCPIAGKPMVERVMDTLAANGISDFILVISPDDHEIISYFNQRSKIAAKIQFVQQKEQLGMGHALLQAAPLIEGDFILSSCDNLVENWVISKMLTRWVSDPLPNGILALLRVGPQELTRMGVVEIDEDHHIHRIVEKPSLKEAPSDIGSVPIYLFSSKLIQYLKEIKPSPRGEYELQDAMQELIEVDGGVYGLLLSGRMDLTHPVDLIKMNHHYLREGQFEEGLDPKTLGNGTRISNPVLIDPGVVIGSNCQIGPHVYIERGAVLEDQVTLENAVVLRGSQVKSGTKADNQVIY